MYYQKKSRFNGAFSRINLPKEKDGACVIIPDENKSVGAHWIALNVNSNNRKASYDEIHFDIFRVKPIPKEI